MKYYNYIASLCENFNAHGNLRKQEKTFEKTKDFMDFKSCTLENDELLIFGYIQNKFVGFKVKPDLVNNIIVEPNNDTKESPYANIASQQLFNFLNEDK